MILGDEGESLKKLQVTITQTVRLIPTTHPGNY